MFLHIGGQREIPVSDLVAVIQNGQDGQGSLDSLVITDKQVLSSPISAKTLHKRLEEILSLLSPSCRP